MTRSLRHHAKKVGLPPGSVVYAGKEKTTPVHATVVEYASSSFQAAPLTDIEELQPHGDKQTVRWIQVDGAHDEKIIEDLGQQLGLHPLVQEDIVSLRQRPKVESSGENLYIVLRQFSFDAESVELKTEQFSLVLGRHFVLTVQEESGPALEGLRRRLEAGQGHLRERGSDYLAYAILDIIVDHYFLVLEELGDAIETLEDDVLETPSPQVLRRIHALRQALSEVRRAIWPLREVLRLLEREQGDFIKPSTMPFLRDVYDHVVHLVDVVESQHELLTGLMELYMSSVSNRMNEVMQFLTIIGTIFIPLTFVTGLYGMNFEYMPELHYRWGYPVLLMVLLTTTLVFIAYFKRKGWLGQAK